MTALLVSLMTVPASALIGSPRPAPALQDDGSLIVYLRPFPSEASRLSFRIESLAALREDGTSLPLSLFLSGVNGGTVTRERRLAARDLPPGDYAGLAIGVGSVSLGGQKGEAALLPPGDAVKVQAPFKIEKRRAVVLSLELQAQGLVEAGARFAPAFAAAQPARPVTGLFGLVSSRGANTVTLFDKGSGRVVGLIPTGRTPTGLALDPARRRAYVASAGEDTVEAIGLLEMAVRARVQLRGGDEPVELALTPDGGTLLAVNAGSNTVSVLDAVSLVEVARVQVGNGPRSIVIDPSGRRAYVFNSDSSGVTVIDITARAVVGTIATEAGPLRGQLSRAGDRLYVIHRSSPNLTVIDPLALAVTSRVYVGPGAVALKVDLRTDRIYLARRNTGSVEVFDPNSFLPVDAIPTGGQVSYLTIDDEGYNLCLVLADKNEVDVLRIVGKEITARVEVGDDPYRVTLAGER